jgi:peptide/nickel transport system substrate-binding protein
LDNISLLSSNCRSHSTKNYEAAFLGWSGRPDPDQNIYTFYHKDGGINNSGYSNPDVDKWLDEARTVTDAAQRKAIYDQIMNQLHEDVPYVYVYHWHNTFAMSKDVQGFEYVADGLIRTVNLSLSKP